MTDQTKPPEPEWTAATCPTCGQECEHIEYERDDEPMEAVRYRPAPDSLLVAAMRKAERQYAGMADRLAFIEGAECFLIEESYDDIGLIQQYGYDFAREWTEKKKAEVSR